mmetsp:Transcript_4127/g.17354  ORF Transcript_4127/g.17354 Transcript_4127/m.17354 type:complete len:239 (-) Transcript_4127:55-771(-)
MSCAGQAHEVVNGPYSLGDDPIQPLGTITGELVGLTIDCGVHGVLCRLHEQFHKGLGEARSRTVGARSVTQSQIQVLGVPEELLVKLGDGRWVALGLAPLARVLVQLVRVRAQRFKHALELARQGQVPAALGHGNTVMSRALGGNWRRGQGSLGKQLVAAAKGSLRGVSGLGSKTRATCEDGTLVTKTSSRGTRVSARARCCGFHRVTRCLTSSACVQRASRGCSRLGCRGLCRRSVE